MCEELDDRASHFDDDYCRECWAELQDCTCEEKEETK